MSLPVSGQHLYKPSYAFALIRGGCVVTCPSYGRGGGVKRVHLA